MQKTCKTTLFTLEDIWTSLFTLPLNVEDTYVKVKTTMFTLQYLLLDDIWNHNFSAILLNCGKPLFTLLLLCRRYKNNIIYTVSSMLIKRRCFLTMLSLTESQVQKKSCVKMSSSLCLAPALGLGVEWGRVEAHDGVALSHDGELLELFHLGWLVGLLQEPLAQGILHRKQGWVNNNHRRRVWYDCTRAIWRKGWIAPGWYEEKD